MDAQEETPAGGAGVGGRSGRRVRHQGAFTCAPRSCWRAYVLVQATIGHYCIYRSHYWSHYCITFHITFRITSRITRRLASKVTLSQMISFHLASSGSPCPDSQRLASLGYCRISKRVKSNSKEICADLSHPDMDTALTKAQFNANFHFLFFMFVCTLAGSKL